MSNFTAGLPSHTIIMEGDREPLEPLYKSPEARAIAERRKERQAAAEREYLAHVAAVGEGAAVNDETMRLLDATGRDEKQLDRDLESYAMFVSASRQAADLADAKLAHDKASAEANEKRAAIDAAKAAVTKAEHAWNESTGVVHTIGQRLAGCRQAAHRLKQDDLARWTEFAS